MANKIIAKNKRAYFDYDLIDTFVAGLVLYGHEVKSIRQGNVDLKGAYVTLHQGEAWLLNAHIKRYQHASDISEHDPERSVKLLLSKKELEQLSKARDSKLTIVALAIEFAGTFIKLRIATARGKKQHDKRRSIQKRDIQRDILRDSKHRQRT